jgi:hypothetical protein
MVAVLILSRLWASTDGILDWRLDLLTTYKTRYYTSQITIAHRLVFSVCYNLHELYPGNGSSNSGDSSASVLTTLNYID